MTTNKLQSKSTASNVRLFLKRRFHPPENNLTHLNQRGVTLPELTTGMAIGAIILLGVSVIIGNAHAYFRKGMGAVALQQDYSLIEQTLLNQVSRSLREKHRIFTNYKAYKEGETAGKEGGCLKLSLPDGSSVLFYKKDDDFIIQGKSRFVLVGNSLQKLNFTSYQTRIKTSVTLTRNKEVIAGNMIHAFRN